MKSVAELAREAGLSPVVTRNEAAFARFAALHIKELCAGVEPVAWSVTSDGAHLNNIFTSDIEANRTKRRLDRDFPDHLREVVPLAPVSTVAALKAQVAELEKDAERYRWLRQEHERVAPICHLSWKAGGDRNSHEWVNTAILDAAIDEALRSKK